MSFKKNVRSACDEYFIYSNRLRESAGKCQALLKLSVDFRFKTRSSENKGWVESGRYWYWCRTCWGHGLAMFTVIDGNGDELKDKHIWVYHTNKW